MPYVIEEVSDTDWQRVLADWEADADKSVWLASKRKRNQEPRKISHWAVDRENGSYLLYGPSIVVGELEKNYSFFYNQRLYWLTLFNRAFPELGLTAFLGGSEI